MEFPCKWRMDIRGHDSEWWSRDEQPNGQVFGALSSQIPGQELTVVGIPGGIIGLQVKCRNAVGLDG